LVGDPVFPETPNSLKTRIRATLQPGSEYPGRNSCWMRPAHKSKSSSLHGNAPSRFNIVDICWIHWPLCTLHPLNIWRNLSCRWIKQSTIFWGALCFHSNGV
jgi:hypothetical protein